MATLLTAKQTPFALSWEAGTTVPLTIQYNRLDGTVPAQATIAEIWVTFKSSLTDNDPGVLQKKLSTGSVQITDAVNGIATAYMTPAESAVPGTGLQIIYYVDVKIKESNGNEWVAAVGTLTLSQWATKIT